MGKGLFPTLRKYATNIDTLITEGTMLNRNDECIHECKVSEKMANVMKAFKYVFVLASATDIERLASIKNASSEAKKTLYVCSNFMASTMKFFTERESSLSRGLFNFSPRMLRLNGLDKIKKKGFVLIAGTSQISGVKKLLKELPIEANRSGRLQTNEGTGRLLSTTEGHRPSANLAEVPLPRL